MSNIEQEFKSLLQKIESKNMEYRPNQQEKLKMYGLFKQINDGDVTGSKPSMMNFVERAKYIAWERCKGMDKNEAMQAYINLFSGKS